MIEDLSGKIDNVSEEIWASMVNIPVVLTEIPAERSQPGGAVTSSVQIVGCWHGAVCIDMPIDLARHATASLIGAEPAEISQDDIRDAAGELANMTAGGVKELLPEVCQISLPTVVMGTDFQFSVPQGVLVYRSAFSTEHGNFQVSLIRGEEQVPLAAAQRMHHEKSSAASSHV